MYDGVTHFWGMHFIWWVFWMGIGVTFFSLLTPVPRRKWHSMRESPQEILLRRLAAGDINEEEFESRKAILDRHVSSSRPLTNVAGSPATA